MRSGKPAFRAPIRVQQKGPPLDFGVAAVPAPCDIDGDGDTDLLLSSVNGYHQGLLNIGTTSQPKWSQAVPMLSNGERYRSVWRTRPVQMDWDGDDRIDTICQNQRGEIGIFPGALNRPWNQLDGWTNWQFEDGQVIDPDADNGMEGRAKIAIADWDHDGRYDLLIGTKGGTPWAVQQGRKNLSYVFFLKGIQGGHSAVFARPRAIRFSNGQDIEVGDHTAAPETATFFGDPKPGLLLGIENGRVHYYPQHELRW